MQRAKETRTGGPCVATLLLAMLVLLPEPLLAQEGIVRTRATTSRAAREDAIRGIPFRSLSRQAQQRIGRVVKKPTMFRRMPVTVIDCDVEMHQFVVRHPETMVNVWQLMGITNLTADRTGQYQLHCADGVGTTTDVELIYGDRNTHVLFCEGEYEGPLFRKPLTGRCVLVLKSGATQTAEEKTLVSNRLDVFLQVDHAGLDIFAKTVHPLLGKSADTNFIESMRFLERLSQAAQQNGPGMQHLVGRLEKLQPAVQQQFRDIVGRVNLRANQEVLAGSPPSASEDPSAMRSAQRKTATLRGR